MTLLIPTMWSFQNLSRPNGHARNGFKLPGFGDFNSRYI